MKNEKHFTRNDITRAFNNKVAEELANGWTINCWTMRGTQGETAKVHLLKDGVIKVIYIDTFHGKSWMDGYRIVTGICKDNVRPDCDDTVWLDKMEVLDVEKFYIASSDSVYSRKCNCFVGTEEEARAIQQLRRNRWNAKDEGDQEHKDQPVQVDKKVLSLVRKYGKGCKSLSASKITGAVFTWEKRKDADGQAWWVRFLEVTIKPGKYARRVTIMLRKDMAGYNG